MGRINVKGVFIGFEKNEIDCIGNDGCPDAELIVQCVDINPAIIDTPGHNGMVESENLVEKMNQTNM